MKKVYIVADIMEGYVIVSTHKTEAGARGAALDHLVNNCEYTAEEWEGFAEEFDFNSVDDLRAAILESNEFDDKFYMAVDEVALED